MNDYRCRNYANCKNNVSMPGRICDACRLDARTLDHKVEHAVRVEQTTRVNQICDNLKGGNK